MSIPTSLRLVALVALVTVGLLQAPPAGAADPDGHGVGLEAVVGQTGGGTGSSGSGHRSGSGSTDEGAADDGDAAVAEPVDTDALAASTVLDVSGLRTRYRASIDPGGGHLAVRLVVRNSSHRTVDASVRFWVTAAGGHRVGSAPTVTVDGIPPGESRTVSQEVGGIGQWTFVTAHAELEPVLPTGAEKMEPVVRDRTVLAVPWAVLALLLVIAAGVVSARLSGDRSARAPGPTPVVVA